MTRYILGDLRTGERILDLPVLTGLWDNRLGVAESISCTVDMNDPDAQSLGLRNAATACKSFLGVVEGDEIMAAGPIWTRAYDRDNLKLTLGAKGLSSYFDHRLILPLLAQTIGVSEWTVPDPIDPTKTMPNPLLSSSYSGLSLGTIAKRLVQQARLWTGGNLPIAFMADELGAAVRNYLGADFKPIGEALKQLSEVEGGPEIRFKPRFTTDRLGVEWVLQTGTATQPLLTSNAVLSWNITAPDSPVSNLMISEDASGMGSLAWQTGGRQSDEVLVARAYESALVDAGYPLMELMDSSHTSVSVQTTLDGYANAAAAYGASSTEVWTFTAKANPVDQFGKPAGPAVGQYAVGDFVDLILAPNTGDQLPRTATVPDSGVFPNPDFFPTDATPWRGHGDPYIPEGGTFRHRIVGISGDAQGENIQIQCAPKVGD